MRKLESLDAEPLGRCPCGKRIYVCSDPMSVMHAVPPCSKFLELEPDEFLTYVRRSRGIPDEALLEN